jgi:hypothetical protein
MPTSHPAAHKINQAPRRGRIVLSTLAAGSLLSTLVVALRPGPFQGDGLSWAFLLAGPLLAALFLLGSVYEVASGPLKPPPGSVLVLAGSLFLFHALGLAMPVLVFQRLSPATTARVELSRHPTAELEIQAMTLPSSRARLEAALGLYLRTGRPARFRDLAGNAAVYKPEGVEANSLGWPRWLAARPGALARERLAMALADAALILSVLLGLAVAIWRAVSHRDTTASGP